MDRQGAALRRRAPRARRDRIRRIARGPAAADPNLRKPDRAEASKRGLASDSHNANSGDGEHTAGFSRALLSVWQMSEVSGENEGHDVTSAALWEVWACDRAGHRAGQRVGREATRRPAAGLAASRAPTPRHSGAAPQYIRDRINELGRSFNGRVGIAVRSVDDGWSDRLEGRRALSAAERQQIVGVDHRARRGRQGPRAARRQGHADRATT